MHVTGRKVEYFKVCDDRIIVAEIRPVKCLYSVSKGKIVKTTNWMDVYHWLELESLIENILKDYNKNYQRGLSGGTQKIEYGLLQQMSGSSIKIGYVYQKFNHCDCILMVPRDDALENDPENEDNSDSLRDKGGRFKRLSYSPESLVISVCPIIKNHAKSKLKLTSDSSSPVRMDLKLRSALNLPKNDGINSVSQYFYKNSSIASTVPVSKINLGKRQPLTMRIEKKNKKENKDGQSVTSEPKKCNVEEENRNASPEVDTNYWCNDSNLKDSSQTFCSRIPFSGEEVSDEFDDISTDDDIFIKNWCKIPGTPSPAAENDSFELPDLGMMTESSQRFANPFRKEIVTSSKRSELGSKQSSKMSQECVTSADSDGSSDLPDLGLIICSSEKVKNKHYNTRKGLGGASESSKSDSQQSYKSSSKHKYKAIADSDDNYSGLPDLGLHAKFGSDIVKKDTCKLRKEQISSCESSEIATKQQSKSRKSKTRKNSSCLPDFRVDDDFADAGKIETYKSKKGSFGLRESSELDTKRSPKLSKKIKAHNIYSFDLELDGNLHADIVKNKTCKVKKGKSGYSESSKLGIKRPSKSRKNKACDNSSGHPDLQLDVQFDSNIVKDTCNLRKCQVSSSESSEMSTKQPSKSSKKRKSHVDSGDHIGLYANCNADVLKSEQAVYEGYHLRSLRDLSELFPESHLPSSENPTRSNWKKGKNLEQVSDDSQKTSTQFGISPELSDFRTENCPSILPPRNGSLRRRKARRKLKNEKSVTKCQSAVENVKVENCKDLSSSLFNRKVVARNGDTKPGTSSAKSKKGKVMKKRRSSVDLFDNDIDNVSSQIDATYQSLVTGSIVTTDDDSLLEDLSQDLPDLGLPQTDKLKCSSSKSIHILDLEFREAEDFPSKKNASESEESIIITSIDFSTSVINHPDFLKTVYDHLMTLTLQDLVVKYRENLDYFWKLIRNEKQTKRSLQFMMNVTAGFPDGARFFGFYPSSMYRELVEIIKDDLDKYASRLGNVIMYGFYVIIPELLKNIVHEMPFVREHGGVTDSELEEAFYDILVKFSYVDT